MPYPQVQHSTASKTLSTTLRDKDATYNRLRKAKANNSGERDPLNRTGHVRAGSPGTHLLHAPLRIDGSRLNTSRAYFIYNAALAEY